MAPPMPRTTLELTSPRRRWRDNARKPSRRPRSSHAARRRAACLPMSLTGSSAWRRRSRGVVGRMIVVPSGLVPNIAAYRGGWSVPASCAHRRNHRDRIKVRRMSRIRCWPAEIEHRPCQFSPSVASARRARPIGSGHRPERILASPSTRRCCRRTRRRGAAASHVDRVPSTSLGAANRHARLLVDPRPRGRGPISECASDWGGSSPIGDLGLVTDQDEAHVRKAPARNGDTASITASPSSPPLRRRRSELFDTRLAPCLSCLAQPSTETISRPYNGRTRHRLCDASARRNSGIPERVGCDRVVAATHAALRRRSFSLGTPFRRNLVLV